MTLSKQTTQPYVQLNNSTAKFPLSLHSLEYQAIDSYFNVDTNVKSFNVKVTFESNQAFICSAETNPFSRNTMDYFLNQLGDSYVIVGLTCMTYLSLSSAYVCPCGTIRSKQAYDTLLCRKVLLVLLS